MSEYYFKEGDLVYYPTISTEVYCLGVNNNTKTYPLLIKCGQGYETFTKQGFRRNGDNLVSIFEATEENRLALETLYGVSFEPLPLKGSAKVRQLLKDNEGSRVLCVVSNEGEAAARNFLCIRAIVDYDVSSFEDQFGISWAYAVPLNEVDTGCLGVHADE